MVKKTDKKNELRKPALGGVFQERLENLMHDSRKKLNRKVIAESANVSESTVSYWLNSLKAPEAESLINLAQSLNISVDYLLGLHETSTLDQSMQEICDFTGLSEDAIRTIDDLGPADVSPQKQIINMLLSTPEFTNDLLFSILSVKNAVVSAQGELDDISCDYHDFSSIEAKRERIISEYRNLRFAVFEFSEECKKLLSILTSDDDITRKLIAKEAELQAEYIRLAQELQEDVIHGDDQVKNHKER